jgi:C-terminal processing protease CtpA/Prc
VFQLHRTRAHWLRAALGVVAVASMLVACAHQRGTVGAKFKRDSDGHLYVREAPEGLGAARAGMQVGDEVILIDGRDVRPLTEQQLHAIMSGDRGSVVHFTVLRGNEVERLAVARTLPPRKSGASKPPE